MIESLPFVIYTLGVVLQAVLYYIMFQYPVSLTNVRIALYISISASLGGNYNGVFVGVDVMFEECCF